MTDATKDQKEPSQEMDDMRAELITRMNLAQTLDHEDREVPRKFKLTKENRRKLEMMNVILTYYVRDFKVDNATKLNCLHYAAAISLAGTRRSNPSKHPNQDPDKIINDQIEKK